MRILNRLESIDGEFKQVVLMSKKQFSDVVKDAKNVSDKWADSIVTTTGEIQTETQKRSMDVMIPDNKIIQRIDRIQRQEMNQIIGQQERYSINRRQKTNAVMSNLISLTGTDYTTECERRPIEPLISDDTSLFRGVVRKRTRRIVLYNVRADRPYEVVSGAVKSYAKNKGVTITFLKLLKKLESRGKSTYNACKHS